MPDESTSSERENVPYYHSDLDSDEVMFHVDGDHEARHGIDRGPNR
ncbi:hypothetical protein R4P52_15880 [Rhodococcus sp. IEGM 1374]|nr:hypothetical protein [uncultured Rhodococcus sp.]MDV7990464.1 hypothetical protein [Rhodococcus sp. IEGM 1374]